MTIVRNESRDSYTVLSNGFLHDDSLSAKAKGIHSVLLSLPDNWKFNQRGLRQFMSDGEDSVRTGLDELEAAGYLKRERERREDGTYGEMTWTVYEEPRRENPVRGPSVREMRRLENTNREITDVESNEEGITSGKPDNATAVREVIAYLNATLGTHYKPTTKDTVKRIGARFKEGFTVDDFKTVIDKKASEWRDDPNMAQYLRPETLFGSKFEGYLNQVSARPKGARASARFAEYDR